MMLVFADGFDWNDSGNSGSQVRDVAATKYLAVGTLYGTAAGRGGVGRSLQFTTDSVNTHLTTYPLRDPTVDAICLFGVVVKTGSAITDNRSWFRVGVGNDPQCAIRYETSDDTFRLFRGDSTLIATSPDMSAILTTSTWHHIEIKLKISDANGFVIMKINGEVVWESSTLLDTKDIGGSLYWDTVRLLGAGLSANSIWDDLYVCDDSGTKNNDYLGDIKVESLNPVADGAQIDFTPSAGGDHYLLVNEFPLLGAPTDSDYTQTNTPGDIELFEFSDTTDLLNNKKIYGVVVNPMVRLTDGQPRETRGIARLKTQNTEGQSNDGVLRQDVFSDPVVVYEDDPNGFEWSSRTVNKTQFGVKLET